MTEQLALPPDPDWPDAPPPKPAANGKPPAPADAKQLRVEHVGALLGEAYKGASQLKLTKDENKRLREDFPDSAIEIRYDGIIYISHMTLRERLLDVFGCGSYAEIVRERFARGDEIAVDVVLMVRGAFVAEAIGSAKYIPSNAKMNFGDVVESAQSEALRRCCKKFGVGTQVWRPGYVRDWLAANAVEYQGRWQRKERVAAAESPKRKTREYTLKEPAQAITGKQVDDDGDAIPF